MVDEIIPMNLAIGMKSSQWMEVGSNDSLSCVKNSGGHAPRVFDTTEGEIKNFCTKVLNLCTKVLNL